MNFQKFIFSFIQILLNQHKQLYSFAKGQLFGEDHILKDKKRNFSVKCDSLDGELYFIRKKDFLQILSDDPEQKYEFLTLAYNKKMSLNLRKSQIEQNFNQFKSFIWEDRDKIEKESKSLIYLDANKKPKSKLDLNEYLSNKQKKDSTIRNENTPTRSLSPLVGLNKRSISLHTLNLQNNSSPQKSNIFQTPHKQNVEKQYSQRKIVSMESLILETERVSNVIEKVPSKLESLQTINTPRSIEQLTPRQNNQINSPKKKIDDIRLNLPILNLEKLNSERLLDYSPRRVLNKSPRNTNKQKKSYSEHQEDTKQLIFLDSGSNFCTHKKEIKTKIINIQSTGIDSEILKKSAKNVSDAVDKLVLSQRYRNYEQTLDFYKNYQAPTNVRNLYKNVVNGNSFNNLLQIKLAEKKQLMQKKEKTPSFSQQNNGASSFREQVKKKTFGNIANLHQINSASQLIQIQTLQKIDDDQSDNSSRHSKYIDSSPNVKQSLQVFVKENKKFILKEQLKNGEVFSAVKQNHIKEEDEIFTNLMIKSIRNSPLKSKYLKF